MKSSSKKGVKKIIGYRRICKATGTGLSHYILVAKSKDKE